MLENTINDVQYKVQLKKDIIITYAPFHGAVFNNSTSIIKILINRPEIDINEIMYSQDKNGNAYEYNILRYAIEVSDIELLELLLKHKGIDVNSRLIDKIHGEQNHNNVLIHELFPLFNALFYHDYDIIKLLLHHSQINVNIKSRKLIKTSNGLIDLILDETPLIHAFMKEDYEIVKLLLSHPKIDVNAVSTFKKNDVNTNFTENLLCLSIENEKYEVTKLLLKHPNIDVNSILICENKNGTHEEKPALYLAVEKGNEEIVKLLLEHNEIDVNCKYFYNDISKLEYQQKTVLQYAFEKGNENIIKCLLSSPKINVNLKSKLKKQNDMKIEEEETTISYAINLGNVEIIKILLENPELNIKIKNQKILMTQNINECDEKNLLDIAYEKNSDMFQFLFNYLKQLQSISGDKILKEIISTYDK